MAYTLVRNDLGQAAGVLRDDLAFIPRDPLNRDWQAFATWNLAQPVPLGLSDGPPTRRVPRPLYAIYTDLQALTGAQKTSVWNDLSSGTPKKYLLDAGQSDAAIGALDWAVSDSGAAGAALTAARLRIAAAYVRDNPKYLVNPPFDPTIAVAGDAPVS